MGRGIVASLARMLADELDVSVASVDMVVGTGALHGGYGHLRLHDHPVLRAGARAAAAEARRS